MAAKKKKKKEFRGLKDIRALWNHLSINQWFDLLKEVAPDHKWEQQNVNTITGSCPKPEHPDRNPSFKLFFNKKYGKCFSCQYFSDDIVNIISKLRGTNYQETLIFLHQRFDLGSLIEDHQDDLIKFNRQQEMKKEAAIATRQIIAELVRDNPSHLQYLKPGLAYLHKGRGLSLAALTAQNALPVGLLGKPEHMKKYIQEEYHEEFDDYFGPTLNKPKNPGSIIFHYNDSPSSISKFKLRYLDRRVINKFGDQDLMQLSQEEAATISPSSSNASFIDDKFYSGGNIGLFGMHVFKHHLGLQGANLYITEGEFDVLSVMAAQIDNDSKDFIILGTCGSGSLDITPLSEYGIRVIWVVPDHPSKNGDIYANTFLQRAEAYNNQNIKIKVFNWPTKINAGDLYDVIEKYGYETVKEHLHTRRNTNFLDAVYWIEERTDSQIQQIKEKYQLRYDALEQDDKHYTRKKESIDHELKSEILTLLTEQLRNLPTSADKFIFMDKYKEKEGIDLTQVDTVTSKTFNLKTFEGVKERIKLTLNEYIVPAFYRGDNEKDWRLHLWSKQEQRHFALSLQAKNINNMFASYVKKTPVALLDNILGDSPILLEGCPDPNDEEQVIRFQKQKEANAQMLVTHTLYDMAQTVPNESDLEFKNQGVHFISGDEDETDPEEGIIYFVNGSYLFKGFWNEKSGQVEWEQIDNCIDGKYRFNLDKGLQWSYVKDVSDLYQASTIDINSLYERMLTVVDAWKFENHEVHRKFLAMNIMSYNIQAAMGYVNMLYIVGDPESGKTTLINGLLSGSNSKGMYGMKPLLESGKLMTTPTIAALKREGNRRTTPVIIDEMGSITGHPDSPEERHAQEVFRLYMNTPMGGAQQNSADKNNQEDTINYDLCHPVIFASPSKTTNDMFLSRTFMLYTIREPGRLFPGTFLRENFSREQLKMIRRELTVAMIPLIYELKKRAPELRDKVFKLPELKPYERFLNTIMCVLLIYDYMGYDAVELAKEIVALHKDRLDELNSNIHVTEAINEVLYTECVNVLSDTNSSSWHSARQMIYENNWNLLNSEGKGVYYLPENNWIIIFWKQAKVKILSKGRQGVYNEQKLREMAAKCEYSLSVTDEEHQAIRENLELWDMKTRNQYTILTGDYIGVETNPEMVKKEREDKKKKLNVIRKKPGSKAKRTGTTKLDMEDI